MVCKSRRVKCDEVNPVCANCTRLGLDCRYAHIVGNRDNHAGKYVTRYILPATAEPILGLQKLGPDEVVYFDHFRYHVVPRVLLGLHEFWSRTVLREAARDEVFLDAVLGISALARARSYPGIQTSPIFRGGPPDISSAKHCRHAVVYYARAVTKTRRLASQPETTAQACSLIITNILFTLFEKLQGNVDAVDKLTGSGILMLSESMKCRGRP